MTIFEDWTDQIIGIDKVTMPLTVNRNVTYQSKPNDLNPQYSLRGVKYRTYVTNATKVDTCNH